MPGRGDDPCTFCEIISTGHPTRDYRELMADDPGISSQPQHLTIGDHLLVAEVAPVVPGHILLIPISHTLATATLPRSARQRLDEIRRSIGRNLAAQDGRSSYLAFEHGTGRPAHTMSVRVKCGPTEHAHVHLMPNRWGDEVLDGIRITAERDGFIGDLVRGLDYDMLAAAIMHEPSTYHFILVGDGVRESSLIFTPMSGNLPSQYFRKYLVSHEYRTRPAVRQHRADWRDQILFDATTPADVRRTRRMMTTSLDSLGPA